MKYRIIRNGIWGVRALDVREFNGGTGIGLFEQMEQSNVDQYGNITREQLEGAINQVFDFESNSTRGRNHRQTELIEEAMRMEVERQMLFSNPIVVGTTSGETEENFAEMWNQAREDNLSSVGINVQRQGFIPSRQDIEYQRLQRGDISMLEYLDNISDEI